MSSQSLRHRDWDHGLILAGSAPKVASIRGRRGEGTSKPPRRIAGDRDLLQSASKKLCQDDKPLANLLEDPSVDGASPEAIVETAFDIQVAIYDYRGFDPPMVRYLLTHTPHIITRFDRLRVYDEVHVTQLHTTLGTDGTLKALLTLKSRFMKIKVFFLGIYLNACRELQSKTGAALGSNKLAAPAP